MGLKLLIVRPISLHRKEQDQNTLVAVDTIGAGYGDLVLCLFGYAAGIVLGESEIPVDAAVAGIVDGYEMEETEAYKC